MNASSGHYTGPEERGNPLDAAIFGGDSSWTQDIARECGVSETAVIEVVGCYQEKSPHGKIDEVQLDAAREVLTRHRDAFHYLIEYQSHQKTTKETRASTRVMALELGHYTAAGANNIATLAKKMHFKKQTLNKMSAAFQARLQLPPRPGQRSDEGKQHMTDSINQRIKQQSKFNHEFL